MANKIKFGDKVSARLRSNKKMESGIKLTGYCKVVCKDKDGNVKWVDEGSNVITNLGVDYILSNNIASGGASIYLGLLLGSPSPAATWTVSNLASTEAAGYDNATRPAWTRGSASSKAVTGTAVTFTMDGADTTIGGAFLNSDNTKDNSTTGTLIAARAFAEGNKTVAADDTLDVTYSISADDSGT